MPLVQDPASYLASNMFTRTLTPLRAHSWEYDIAAPTRLAVTFPGAFFHVGRRRSPSKCLESNMGRHESVPPGDHHNVRKGGGGGNQPQFSSRVRKRVNKGRPFLMMMQAESMHTVIIDSCQAGAASTLSYLRANRRSFETQATDEVANRAILCISGINEDDAKKVFRFQKVQDCKERWKCL